MSTFFILKDPSDKLDYTIDYSYWLVGSDTILTSTWTGDGNVTIVSSSTTSNSATVYVQGGTSSTTSTITNVMTTVNSPSRIVNRRIEFTLQPR